MADVNDTNNSRGRLEREWELLDGSDTEDPADIEERDRTAIRRFVEYRRDSKNKAVTTLVNDLGNLRRSAERAAVPLCGMDQAAVGDLLATLTAHREEGGYGLDPDGSGMFGYKRVLRLFFKWLDAQPARDDYSFWESIELPQREIGTVDEDYNFSEGEIAALKRHAEYPRDRALIDFLADVCGRISLVTQLRYGDIAKLNTDRPHYRPNDEAINQKGAPIKHYPIADARAELRVFMQRYHIDPRDEAPLFHLLGGHYDHENPGQCAMSGDRVRDMLRECAARAVEAGTLDDIAPERVHPHNFRHTGITRLRSAGVADPVIAHIAGFTDDKMRMLSHYDHTEDTERNEHIYELGGYIDERGDGLDTPETESKSCGNCGERLAARERFCARCGVAVDETAGERIEAFKTRTRDRTVEEENVARRRVLLKLAEAAGIDPDEVEAVLG